MAPSRDLYLNQSIQSAAQILAAFSDSGEVLRFKDLVARTGFGKSKTYRLLYTLEACGFIERVNGTLYRALVRPPKQRKYKIGYAWPGEDYKFAQDVIESVERAAKAEGISVVLANNEYNPKVALHNADMLIKEGVHLAMEFQTDEQVAPIIAAKYHEAGIPLIAVEIPHPGATFYGANNYQAGLIGGRALGRWAKQCWQGEVEEIVMLELPRAGSLPAARLTGMVAGIREVMRSAATCPVHHLDGNGQFGASLQAVRKHLRRGGAKRTLLGAINDPSVLGGLRAFEEAGRLQYCAAMGQNASPEARAELRRRGSSLIGSVGYFPERYGDELIPLALDILNRRPVPPAIFIKHKLIDASNVDHFYPNDALR